MLTAMVKLIETTKRTAVVISSRRRDRVGFDLLGRLLEFDIAASLSRSGFREQYLQASDRLSHEDARSLFSAYCPRIPQLFMSRSRYQWLHNNTVEQWL
jgi:hypothetical protein